jgi:hypothetical protein
MSEKQDAVMPRRLEHIVSTCRLLSEDSGPDGWPAIPMKDITALCDAVEKMGKALTEIIALESFYQCECGVPCDCSSGGIFMATKKARECLGC